MRPQDDDPDLARSFADLRTHDRRRAPQLDHLLARASAARRARRARWRPVSLAAVLVLALAAAVAGWRIARSGPEPAAGAAVDLLAWRAPSDALLQTPGRRLLAELPELGGGGFFALPAAGGRPKGAAAGSPRERKEARP